MLGDTEEHNSMYPLVITPILNTSKFIDFKPAKEWKQTGCLILMG
jgi:hypothetical protein